MIVYDNRAWLGALSHFQGTVLPSIVMPVGLVALWSIIVNSKLLIDLDTLDIDITSAHRILGAFVSFFLIFRTNQAYGRYWHSNQVLKDIQVSCRELHQQFLCYLKGGMMNRGDSKEADFEQQAMQAKTDATRYILAYCVAFKLHSRIAYDGYMCGTIPWEKKMQVDYDRSRLRGLLSAEEFTIIDNMIQLDHTPRAIGIAGDCSNKISPCCSEMVYWVSTEVACRSCHVIIFFLRCLAYHCSINAKDWGWFERCLNLADGSIQKLMLAFEEMDQNITTPLPLPYCHLCKSLMFIFLFVFPIVGVNFQDGSILNIITPCVIALAMFGIEVISMEIEDPFGDDVNDFDTMRILAGIEGSMHEVMITRNDPSLVNFIMVEGPPGYKDCRHFLWLKTERTAAENMMRECAMAEARGPPPPSEAGRPPVPGGRGGYQLLTPTVSDRWPPSEGGDSFSSRNRGNHTAGYA